MRTTVDIEDDLLLAAKHLARDCEQILGRVLSDLVRRGLQPVSTSPARRGSIPVLTRKPGARTVTSQAVKDLLDAEPCSTLVMSSRS